MRTPLNDDIAVFLYCNLFNASPQVTRHVADQMLGAMARTGCPPNLLSISGAKGWSSGLKTFSRMKGKYDTLDFTDVRAMTVEMRPKDRSADIFTAACCAYGGISRTSRLDSTPPNERIRYPVCLGALCLDVGQTSETLIDAWDALACQLPVSYAYVCHMRRGALPMTFDLSVGFHGSDKYRTTEEIRNRRTWSELGVWEHQLRDIYPVNVIGRTYLDWPIQDQTLEAWIRADALRGTLAQRSESLWSWRPPIDQISFLREPLFRAGLLHWHGFYDRFTQRMDEFDPAIAFEIPAKTPAMFRPDFWKGKDPGITN